MTDKFYAPVHEFDPITEIHTVSWLEPRLLFVAKPEWCEFSFSSSAPAEPAPGDRHPTMEKR